MSMIYVYSCAPIDLWHGPVEALEYVNDQPRFYSVQSMMDDNLPVSGWSEDQEEAEAVVSLLRDGTKLARNLMWEGDFRTPPHICFVPYPDAIGFKKILVWKQDNNGTTFVVSEISLPWLEEYSCLYCKRSDIPIICANYEKKKVLGR